MKGETFQRAVENVVRLFEQQKQNAELNGEIPDLIWFDFRLSSDMQTARIEVRGEIRGDGQVIFF